MQTFRSFPPRRRFARYLAEHRAFRDFFELSLVGIAFLFYFLVRGSTVDRTGEAFNRAVRIIDLEQKWGFFWELELQALIMGSKGLIQFFNAIYFWLDFPLIVVVGLWLYFRHRHQYTITRDAILSSGAIALVIYHLFPVAQFAAIVFTGNHFIFDAIIGLVVSLMGLVIAIMLQRFGYAYLRGWLGKEPAVKARARSA